MGYGFLSLSSYRTHYYSNQYDPYGNDNDTTESLSYERLISIMLKTGLKKSIDIKLELVFTLGIPIVNGFIWSLVTSFFIRKIAGLRS